MVRKLSRSSSTRARLSRAFIEPLQERVFMSVTPSLLSTDLVFGHRESNLGMYTGPLSAPSSASLPDGYSPSQVRSAYGLDQISFGSLEGTGAGQTIAIVDAYDDPNIGLDLAAFDREFSLSAPPSMRVLNQTGGTILPGTDPNASSSNSWEMEESLDVEWAHAIAPGANIILYEANSSSNTDLYAAVNTARNASGVSVVSMSFGSAESTSDEQYDSIFTTPAGHGGVTFVASSGDDGSSEGENDSIGNEYPASSPNVLAVGGTSLYLTSSNGYESESAWSGSGGGISAVYTEPSFQSGVVTTTNGRRGVPDVSFLADPKTGVSIVDSFDLGTPSPWMTIGGTSLSAPCWAGVIAIVNQGRVSDGRPTLDGATQTLPGIYNLSSSDFNDITSGNNGAYSASYGYDEVTGRGSPRAMLVVADLALIGAQTTKPTPPPQAANGSVSGVVFWDMEDDATYHGSWEGMSGWTVFVDNNKDGQLDAGDVYTTTNAFGKYTFSQIPIGDVNIDVDMGNGEYWYPVTSPVQNVTLSSTQPAVTNQNFAVNDYDSMPSFASLVNGKLTINGTSSDDLITLDRSGQNYVATLNGSSQSYPAAGVSSVEIYSGDGDDVVFIGTGVIGVYVNASAGDDYIVGGDGADTITGGAGKDVIYGGTGDDRLNGNGGHDQLFGEAGKDRLYGGDGNDTLDGGSSTDRMWGEAGNNTYYGEGGNDYIYARNGSVDVIFGGSGTDHAQVDGSDSVAAVEDILA